MIRRARPSRYALLLLATAGGAVAIAALDARLSPPVDHAALTRQVATWGLTDLALFTEARYTRHLSQADAHAAFQDHPGALEHFPTGALLPPPAHLRPPPRP